MSNAATRKNLNYYKKLYSSVKSLNPEWIVIGNPGTATDSKLFSYTDIMVTFESSQFDYFKSVETKDTLSSASRVEASFIYEVTNFALVKEILSIQRNYKWVYLTSRKLVDDPWARLEISLIK